jgi:hypothetical protein
MLNANDLPRVGQSQPAEVLIRAARVHTLSPGLETARSLAIRGDSLIAVSAAPDGLDHLVTADTLVIDDSSLTVLPAFNDTHNHLLEATRNATFVPLSEAHEVSDVITLIKDRAARTAAGRWIQTSNAWHEQQLKERRLPTAQELDEATHDHPVLLRRGGHMAVLNSVALRESGITPATSDPPGGRLGRRPDGSLDGMLEGGAQYALVRVPSVPIDEQIARLEHSCHVFTSAGIGTIRDPVVSPDGMRLYQAAAAAGRLSLRVRPLLLVSPAGSVEQRIGQLDNFALRSGFGNEWIRVWGLKFVMDGGPEGGALDQPYENDPAFTGHLNWEVEELFTVMDAGVQRGWRVATHAIGDRAVRTVLDVYERLVAAHPQLPPRTLAIEHAFLTDRTQRRRAIAMGVRITVQHALLHALGASLVKLWGSQRTSQIMPVKAWLDEGADLSAGTDYPIGFYEPTRTLWGMVTRQTASVGQQGLEHAVDRDVALRLCTIAGAQLSGESDRLGSLVPGHFADIVAFRTDPLSCPVDDLWDLKPVFTMVGGRAVFDPEGALERRRAAWRTPRASARPSRD